MLFSTGFSQSFHILSKDECSYHITHDTIDDFFSRVQPLEVSIQLKNSSIADWPQERASDSLVRRMKEDCLTPNSQQEKMLRLAMEKALAESIPLLPHYPLPDTIHLGVIKGELYGPSVFFTRENGIFIPAGMIQTASNGMLKEVLIHEIFHILSRFHPDLQEKVYATMGFTPLPGNPKMSQEFQQMTLLNPDGTDWNYAISLWKGADTILAFPMIRSNEKQFTKAKPNFFQYLEFQLYPLELTTDGTYIVRYDESLNGLDGSWMDPFFARITDNTQYIIHPDELSADNFVLLTKKQKGNLPKLSSEGNALLEELERIFLQP